MSKRTERVSEAAAWLLHATAWKETSIIAQVFSQNYGIVTVVAKGAKKPYSVLRPILSSFTPLSLSWSGQGEVKTLTRSEVAGWLPIPSHYLMSAWYMNELLLYFLAKEDAYPELYDIYHQTLIGFVEGKRASMLLRRFEWHLLKETGYAVSDQEPNFEDECQAREWRPLLRGRIEQQMEQRRLKTRRVMLDLNIMKSSL